MKTDHASFGQQICQAALSVFAWIVLYPATARATDSVDYLRDVKPLLARHCYACHGALKQESELRVDTVASMWLGGASGPAISARKPSTEKPDAQPLRHLLLERVRSADPAERMPPETKSLSESEIAILERWLASGAAAPADEPPQADPMDHWSFVLPRQAPLPENTAEHPIDRFLATAAQERNVVPLQPASKRELLRRITLDLIGLPPTKQELDEFLGDESPSAYQRVVDRLLERPEYGERWGRHWMDVWRYSDWYGRRSVPDVMNSYPQIWRWRDWIVRSLCADKGYDRMLMEMLAADELSPADDENLVATGFIVRNWFKWNYETWMKDNVEHTGKAFLGLTLNCAQCHDHKFDPITQEDYFRFRAFFEPLELRHDRVPGEADPGPFQKYVYAKSYGPIKAGAIRIFDEKLDAQTFMFRGGDARNRIEGRPPVEAGPPRAFTPDDFRIAEISLPPEASYPGLKDFIRRDELLARQAEIDQSRAAAVAAEKVADSAQEKLAHLQLQSALPATAAARPPTGALLAAERERFDAHFALRTARAAVELAIARRDALQARIAADDAAYRAIGDPGEAAQLANLAEKQVAYHAAQHAVLAAEHAAIQAERSIADAAANPATNAAADATKKAAAVAAAKEKLQAARAAVDAARSQLAIRESTYAPLSPKYPTATSGRRAALARWIASEKNPLTARVAVNHMWLRHFGQPLVETVDNLGVQGKPPVHPELLDWLAVEFMSHDWSMKHLHRLIVTSAAYRRSSSARVADHPNLAVDRDNVTYWQFPQRRMEAEVVRDSVLFCAGALDRSLGGHEIDVADWINVPRRSLYFTQHGEAQMLFLATFDGPNACECYRRTSTVLPSQALAMSNSELLVHYGRLCAQRLSARLPRVAAANTAGAQTAEAGAQTVEAGAQTVEAGAQTVEAGAQTVEAGAQAAEAGAQTVEAGAQTAEAGAQTAQLAADEAFAQLAFETLLSRPASALELRASLEFLDDQRVQLAGNSAGQTSADRVQRARENLVIALFNHNDFVTIR